MKPQLFLDLDGVLADFDGHFEQIFGVRPNQDTYEPPGMWDKIRRYGRFYRDMPMMGDGLILWEAVKHLNPIILTGVPYSILDADMDKKEWCAQHLDPFVEVICCPSRDKCEYGKPGDILVDDRLKYSHFWIKMGGIFLHHKSTRETLPELSRLLGVPIVVP